MTTTDPVVRWRAAVEADAAITATVNLLDHLDRLLTSPGRSRPGARRDLDQLGHDLDAVRQHLRRSSLDWADIRDAAVTELFRTRGPLDRPFRVTRADLTTTWRATP